MTRAIHGIQFALKKPAHTKVISVSHQAWLFVLMLSLMVSAFSLVYCKDMSRRLFIDYQQLQHLQQTQMLEQNKLLLEKNKLMESSRIQKIAIDQLGMVTPAMQQVVILRD
jgi:cell division protein FtsL